MISAFDPSNVDEKVVQAKLTTHEKYEGLNCILTKICGTIPVGWSQLLAHAGRVYDVINVCNAPTPLLYRDGSHACEVHPHAKGTLYISITQYSFLMLGVLYTLDT